MRGRSAVLLALTQSPLAELTDGQLLDRVPTNDQAAFECLVWRHGPMVLGTCRRLLPEADAEDAFQATFLVLFRQAVRVPQERVGAWLHGVAYRVASKMRTTHARRVAREVRVAQQEARPTPEPPFELRECLDHALAHLPAKYRVPLVLCELQGQALHETATQLGWPQGTVASRLARGRALLAERLRGAITFSALVVPVITATLVQATCRGLHTSTSATPIARAVLQSLWITKMKHLALSLTLFVGVVTLTSWGLMRSHGETPKDTPKGADPMKPVEPRPKEAPLAPADVQWGTERDGIKLGISYATPSDTYRAGEPMRLNVWALSAKEQKLVYADFTRTNLPIILDTAAVGGRQYALKLTTVADDDILRQSQILLPAGERVLLATVSFTVEPRTEDTVGIQHRPGIYELSYAAIGENGAKPGYNTGKLRFVIAKPDVKLADLPSILLGNYRVQPVLRAAIALQALGKDDGLAKLKELAAADDDGFKTLSLIRMLIEPKPGAKLDRAMIGAGQFPGGTTPQQWLLDPIEIVDGVPFLVATGYRIAGQVEHPRKYLDRCLENGVWSTTIYTPKNVAELHAALAKLWADKRLEGKGTGAEYDFTLKQLEMVEVLAEQAVFAGQWRFMRAEKNGKPHTPPDVAPLYNFAKDRRHAFPEHGNISIGEIVQLDPTTYPKRIDLQTITKGVAPPPALGIYELTGDRLRICLGAEPTADVKKHDRPTNFETGGTTWVLYEYERERIEWGPAVKGLQLGLVLSSAKVAPNEPLTFRLYVRNTSNEHADFETPDFVFHHPFTRPHALNNDGKEAKLIMQLFPGAAPEIKWTKRHCGPTSIIAIGTATWDIRTADWQIEKPEQAANILLAPGTHKVQFKDYDLRGLGKLNTGVVPFEMQAPK